MTLENLQNKLGYTFRKTELLLRALTHSSYGHEFLKDRPVQLRDNERLEFLGDALLDVIVSQILMERYPEASEGELSKMRAALVNERALAEIASKLGLYEHIRLGNGESQTGGSTKPSILAGTLEALIAAIFQDSESMDTTSDVVRRYFEEVVAKSRPGAMPYDYKTRYQEVMQSRYKITPTYRLLNTRGPDHAKVFFVEVSVDARTPVVFAEGPSKKAAEQTAAMLALRAMGGA